jgi:hypothetical protein
MNHPSTTTKIHVEFASVLKQLARSPEGVPVLRLRVSGTKMDRTAYVHDSGVEVVGEKIVPELLATMWQEAKAGRVYLLENHSATMPMGWSAEADLKDLGDGNQELYVDFVLDMDVSPARDLVHILEARPDYEPQCSVGLMVMREIAWDEEEGGYVGRLTEGRFEHVAMTRPDHAAYPDADVEEIFLSDSLVEAAKSLTMTTASAVIKARSLDAAVTLDPNAASMKGATAMRVKVGSSSPDEESGSGVKVRESVEKAAVEVAKEAAAEAIATLKEAEAEDNKEADADAEAKKEDSADAEAAMEKEEMSKEDTMKGLAEHCRSLGKSIAKAKEEGASPDDIKALMDDLQADYEALCQMLEAAGVDMGEKDADAPAADEDEPPAKGEEEKEDADDAGDDDEDKPAVPAKKADEPVMKSKTPKKAAKPEPTEDERIMALVTKAIGSKLDEINKRLEHFDDLTPATPLPKRYNANEADAEEGSEMDRIEKMVRGIKDPKDRELITKSLAESLVTGHFTRNSN